MAQQLYGKNYADMSEKYRRNNTKAEFKAARREQRMAGEKMQEDTPAAAEASESVQKAAKRGAYESGQQYYNSDRELVDMGAPNKDYKSEDNNPYTVENISDFDLAAGGAGSSKGTNRLSAQDIRRLREQGGFSRQEIVDYAENHDFGDGPGASGGKAQALLQQYKDAIAKNSAKDEEVDTPEPTPEPAPTPELTPEPAPAPKPTVPPGGNLQTQEQESTATVTGDNSNAASGQQANTAAGGGTQQTQIAGDGNTVTNNQSIDNSVDNSRTYGGSTRSFTYNPSGGATEPFKETPLGTPAKVDDPVSKATMAGFYEVDDSPAANASRLDRQIDQNRENQKYYKDTSSIAQKAIDNAAKNAYINPANLDKRIAAREQNSFDRSTLMGANIFGDMFAFQAPKWNSPKDPEKVEQPDFQGMYETYTKF